MFCMKTLYTPMTKEDVHIVYHRSLVAMVTYICIILQLIFDWLSRCRLSKMCIHYEYFSFQNGDKIF